MEKVKHQGILPFSCFWTFFNTIKCLETEETAKSLEQSIFFKGYSCFSCFLIFFCILRCLGTGKITTSLEEVIFFEEFCSFSCFLTFFVIKCVQKQENPLKILIFPRDFVVFLLLDTFESKKSLKIGEMTKSLQNNDFLRGFGRFSCFETLLKRKEGRNMRK